jgi:hypothetical protein
MHGRQERVPILHVESGGCCDAPSISPDPLFSLCLDWPCLRRIRSCGCRISRDLPKPRRACCGRSGKVRCEPPRQIAGLHHNHTRRGRRCLTSESSGASGSSSSAWQGRFVSAHTAVWRLVSVGPVERGLAVAVSLGKVMASRRVGGRVPTNDLVSSRLNAPRQTIGNRRRGTA